jgi:hypothetical protein
VASCVLGTYVTARVRWILAIGAPAESRQIRLIGDTATQPSPAMGAGEGSGERLWSSASWTNAMKS